MNNSSWWVNQNVHLGGKHNDIVWAPSAGEGDRPAAWSWKTLLTVSAGDYIFHYTNQHIVGLSRALGSAQERDYPYEGKRAWGTHGWRVPVDYAPLDWPITRDDIPLNIRLENHSSLGGPFDKNGNVVQGYLLPVNADLSARLLDLIGFTKNDDVSQGASYFEERSHLGPTDGLQLAVRRVEQAKLRQHLLAGCLTASCGLCGIDTQAQYLVAAHIKPRSLCTDRERRDLNVAMLACVMGCDATFEDGGIHVDASGYMTISNDLLSSRPQTFAVLQNAVAPAFNNKNAKYFHARVALLRPEPTNLQYTHPDLNNV